VRVKVLIALTALPEGNTITIAGAISKVQTLLAHLTLITSTDVQAQLLLLTIANTFTILVLTQLSLGASLGRNGIIIPVPFPVLVGILVFKRRFFLGHNMRCRAFYDCDFLRVGCFNHPKHSQGEQKRDYCENG
jgi:hypothetical protein